MCSPVRTTGRAMPTAVEMPEALVGKPLATISLPGTVAADGGLGASVSASQGLRFHFEDRPRFVLSPRPVPDDFGGEARCDFRPLPRQEGECAVLGLRRLLGLSLQPTEPAEATPLPMHTHTVGPGDGL